MKTSFSNTLNYIPKIIADTNVWYLLGKDEVLFEKYKNERVIPNYVNIIELSKTENIVEKEEYTRSAIQKMFHFKDYVIYEPPFICIAQHTNDYQYDIIDEMGSYLEFTSRFASGEKIDLNKETEFFNWVAAKKSSYQIVTDYFNDVAAKVRLNIVNKKIHRKSDSLQFVVGFINRIVEISTDNKCNIKGLDLDLIELLVKTMDVFFKTIELSKMKIQPNDWFDLSILGYVRPWDKYWTEEKRWINLIKEAGCEKYLLKK